MEARNRTLGFKDDNSSLKRKSATMIAEGAKNCFTKAPKMDANHTTPHRTLREIYFEYCRKLVVESQSSSSSTSSEEEEEGEGNTVSVASSVGSCSGDGCRSPKPYRCDSPEGSLSCDYSYVRCNEEKICSDSEDEDEDEDAEVDSHTLEIRSYHQVMEALSASSPALCWDQEERLSHLRLSLHITDEEYLIEVRSLLASPTRGYLGFEFTEIRETLQHSTLLLPRRLEELILVDVEFNVPHDSFLNFKNFNQLMK